MSLIKLWHKKNGSHQTKKYLLPIFTALCVAALIFTGCADSAESSSKTSAEKISVTVKTEADVSSDRSILPSLCGTFRLYFKEKGASDSDYTLADGEYPDYQMIIIPGEYTFRLESVSEDNSTVILTGETDFTVESGMENVTICFMLSSPEGATGNGSVSLFLSADTDTNIETFSVSAVGTEGKSSFSWSKDEEETSYLKGTLSCTSLAPGTYTLVITGLNSLNEPVYVRHEVLTIWSNVVSGRWLFADGTETDELTITTSDLYSTFYVKGEEGPYNFYTNGVFGDENASDDNSGSIDCPLQTVSAAVNKCVVSNKPYTIYVDGTVKESKFTTNDPTAISIPFGKQITIKSLNPKGETKAVIQADGNGRIMYASGTVVLEDLVLKGGGNTDFGGGIFVSSAGVFTMKNCTLTGCNATLKGGGLYIATRGSANLSGCTISGNNATDENNGIGGGIYVVSAGALNMKKCTLTDCNATTSGGGLYIASNGLANLFDCTISYCRCIGGGGGIYIASGVTATITGCELIENTTEQSGGAIKNSGTLNITDCSFSKNKANFGGGIYIESDVTATITGCKISENSANGSGGGLKICSSAELTNCEILQNSASGDGGGLECICRDTTQINVTFTKCKIIEKNTSGNCGGGVSINSNVKATFNNCEINGNTARYNGGGLLLWHQNGYSDPDVTLTDCTISSNTANNENGNGGGGIRTDGGGLTLKLTGTTSISGNITQSGGVGKGIYLNSGYMYISGAIQIDDDVRIRTDGSEIRTTITGSLTGTTPVITITPTEYTAGKQIVSAGSGVTLSDEAGKFKISNPDYIISKEGKLCYLGTTSTTAEDNIAVFTNIPAGCEATVNLDNLSQTSWSGFSPAEISGNVTVTATNGKTISSGSDSIFTVKNGGTLTLNENVTLETSSPGKSCINVEEGGTLILDGAVIQATPGYNVSGITITHGTLTINTGNITNFTGSPIVATDSIITITGGKISSNSSNLSLTNCQADISGLTVTSNTTSSNGGGINISGSGTYTFNNCTITSNTASVRGGTPRYGGGIYIDTTGTVSFTKCNISGNTANGYGSSSGKGGGIYLKSGTLTTTDCTINNNITKDGTSEVTGSGSQIYVVAGSVYNGETLTEDKIIDTYSE